MTAKTHSKKGRKDLDFDFDLDDIGVSVDIEPIEQVVGDLFADTDRIIDGLFKDTDRIIEELVKAPAPMQDLDVDIDLSLPDIDFDFDVRFDVSPCTESGHHQRPGRARTESRTIHRKSRI